MSGYTQARRRRQRDYVGAHVFGAVCFAVLLVLVNVWPGWQVVPLLTDEMGSLLWLVNLSLGLSLFTQLAFLVDENPRLRALARYVIALVDMVLCAQLLIVFPFDLVAADPAWTTALRLLLWAGVSLFALRAVFAASRLVRSGAFARLGAGRIQTT